MRPQQLCLLLTVAACGARTGAGVLQNIGDAGNPVPNDIPDAGDIGDAGCEPPDASYCDGGPWQACLGDGGVKFIENHQPCGPLLLPACELGFSYEGSLAVACGVPPYRWVAQSTLPAGMHLTRYGTLTGTPTTQVPEDYTFSVTVTDSVNTSDTQTFLFQVVQTTGICLGDQCGQPPPGCDADGG